MFIASQLVMQTGVEMGSQTNFAALVDGQQSTANTVAGLRADVAYWRELAAERAAKLSTAVGALAQAAAQINGQALDLIRMRADVSARNCPPVKAGFARAALEIDGDEFVVDYDPESLDIEAIYIGPVFAGPYLTQSAHDSLRSLLEQHVEDAAEEAKQDAHELAAEARRETNKEL